MKKYRFKLILPTGFFIAIVISYNAYLANSGEYLGGDPLRPAVVWFLITILLANVVGLIIDSLINIRKKASETQGVIQESNKKKSAFVKLAWIIGSFVVIWLSYPLHLFSWNPPGFLIFSALVLISGFYESQH